MGFNGRMSGAGGVISIYTGDDTITDPVRNVQVGTTLNFLYGAAGVNGSVQMTTGGYFKNQTSIASNYWEYNNVDGIFKTVTDTHTVTGFRAENGGGVGNPTSSIEMFAGSNGSSYFNTNGTTGILYFLTNNTAVIAGMIYVSSGAWGIGGFADHSTSLKVTGKGATAATRSVTAFNSVGTASFAVWDDGKIGIGQNALTEDFLSFSSGLGRFFIGNALRSNQFVGTDHIFPNNIWYNSSRAGATADTGHNLGLFTLTSRCLGEMATAQVHHLFDTVGNTHNDAFLFGVRRNGNQHFRIYGDGRVEFNSLPTYADDAAAGVGGLTIGMVYKTATGELRIKL
jgi:hypothetical protein